MEEEVDVEEILTEDQMEQKDNPWAEGIEAGPRDSEELFLKKVKVALLCCVRNLFSVQNN